MTKIFVGDRLPRGRGISPTTLPRHWSPFSRRHQLVRDPWATTEGDGQALWSLLISPSLLRLLRQKGIPPEQTMASKLLKARSPSKKAGLQALMCPVIRRICLKNPNLQPAHTVGIGLANGAA